VDVDLTEEDVRRLGQAFGTYLRRHRRQQAVVGRDIRSSSRPYRDALVAGLTAAGVSVVDIGEVTTPMFYFARLHLAIDGGVMITASHNPPQFNGFKLAMGAGTLFGEEIQAVRRLLESGDWIDEGGGQVASADVAPAYLAMLAEKIRLGPRRLRVAVDCGNGTPALFVHRVMSEAFAIQDWIPLYCTPDPTFPNHHPDPVVAHNLRDLIAAVVENGADLGIAFDGDGDRLGVVDDRGRIVWGDRLMVLFWREILARRPGARAIIEVKCSQTLYDEVKRLGGQPEFYKTGHSLIKNRMRETGAVFAGEMSGHMFFADEYYGYDDAFYAAGRLLRILSHSDRPLSKLLADVPELPATPEVRIDCPDDRKFAVVEALKRRFQERSDIRLIDIDGVRVVFPHGWGLIRASNTQPALVVRAEAQTPRHLAEIERELEAALAAFDFLPAPDWNG
jgi:phosphomannomutase/phosphoglucomutase